MIAFGCTISLVFAGAAKAATKLVKSRSASALSKLDYLLLALGLFGIACITYGFFEPYKLEITNTEITSDKIRAGGSPLKIVHLSDIHCDGNCRAEKQVLAGLRNLYPDLILFTGDAANNRNGRIEFHELAKSIGDIAPTFAVLGNHDKHELQLDLYRDTNIKVLDGTSETMTIRGTKVWIGGAAVDNKAALNPSCFNFPSDSMSIFLYHYPIGIESAAAQGVTLFLAGHTHGGQIRLPFYGALITNSCLGKKYEAGLYKANNTWVYINRGVGMIGLPVRFLCQPEIAVITIKSPPGK